MSNPFNFMNCRGFLKASLLGILLKVSTTGNTAQVDFILFDGKVADSYTRSA